jgi:peptidyl-Asp metalloendopeptidase
MRLKSNFAISILLLATVPFVNVYAAVKDSAPDFFEYASTPTIAGEGFTKNTVKGRKHRVKVNHELMDLNRLRLNLFDDVIVTAVLNRLVKNHDSKSWIGHIEGQPENEVFLTLRRRSMSGTVQIGDKTYEIEPKSRNQHDVVQVNPDKNPEHSHSKQPEDFLVTGGQIDTTLVLPSAPIASAAASAGTIIDVLVVYTTKAKNNSSGQAGIEAKIANAVAMANQAYLNSKIDMQINLVGMVETNYQETGNMSTTLTDLTGTNDGKMDEVHSLRNQYGADQVTLISADTNYCGIAYMMNSSWISTAFAPYAFSVVHDDSVYACLSNQTFAHELGHNQGDNHNIEDSGGSEGVYSYSYGHRLCQTGGFRTVMSYSCPGGTRVSYFSNPNVTLPTGEVTGTALANNALSMNNTKAVVAAFRPSITSLPIAPSNLSAIAVSDNLINLTWSDSATNENGFRLERSGDGVNWAEFAVVASNMTSYSDTGRNPSTTYFYRARAYNSSGNSNYSNIGSASTSASCNSASPGLTIFPASQYTKPSTSVKLNISLMNQDSSGCTPVNFKLTNNFGVSIGSFQVNPGASLATSWTITTPTADGRYINSVNASAANHSVTNASTTIIVDGTAPSSPAYLVSSVSRRAQVKLAWNASVDSGSGVDHYEIFRNGIKIATVTGTSYMDKPGYRGVYIYAVLAFDKVGNSAGTQKLVTL